MLFVSVVVDRVETCNRVAEEKGYSIIPPYDHPDVMAGQVSCALAGMHTHVTHIHTLYCTCTTAHLHHCTLYCTCTAANIIIVTWPSMQSRVRRTCTKGNNIAVCHCQDNTPKLTPRLRTEEDYSVPLSYGLSLLQQVGEVRHS